MDKLIDFLINFIDLFRFWVVIDYCEKGVVSTWGRLGREISSNDGWFSTGLHLIWPLGIEEAVTVIIQDEWDNLFPQSLMTSDGQHVVVQGSFQYTILPEKVTIHVETLGEEGAARDGAMRAAIALNVESRPHSDLVDDTKELRKAILSTARGTLNPYGYKLKDFQWLQKIASRTYRLIDV